MYWVPPTNHSQKPLHLPSTARHLAWPQPQLWRFHHSYEILGPKILKPFSLWKFPSLPQFWPPPKKMGGQESIPNSLHLASPMKFNSTTKKRQIEWWDVGTWYFTSWIRRPYTSALITSTHLPSCWSRPYQRLHLRSLPPAQEYSHVHGYPDRRCQTR